MDESQSPPTNVRRLRLTWAVGLMLVALVVSVSIYAFIVHSGEPVDPNKTQPTKIKVHDPTDAVPIDPSQNDELSKLLASLFTPEVQQAAEHPIDPALEVAELGLQYVHREIRDYTATIVKRERIGRNLREEEYIFCKIRHEQKSGDQITTPLSVYLRFLKPEGLNGREIIWIRGHNDGQLTGHEGGLKKFIRYNLDPTSFLAMQGNRYPIMEIGIENLMVRLIEKGERQKNFAAEEVEVTYRAATLNDRPCTLINIRHPQRDEKYEFYEAQIFIDNELRIPVRYAAYLWPKTEGGQPTLEEEYTYRDIKLNVGLTDLDFDPKNPEYEF